MFAGTLDEVTFDNRGTWNVNLRDAIDGDVEYSAAITVHDATAIISDLQISKFYSDSSQANANETLTAAVWVFNYGPDDAQNVQVDDTTPSNTTFSR